MNMFEKIIIPLLDDNINVGDVGALSGFKNAFTCDPDKPCSDKALYLLYDDSIRTKDTALRYSRFETLNTIKYKYIKYIDAKPYLVYQFYIKPEIKKLFYGNIKLTPKQVARIIEFWGVCSDVADYICKNGVKFLDTNHDMPFEDYEAPPIGSLFVEGFTIQKGELLK